MLAWAWVRFVREKHACDCEGRDMPGHRAGLFMLIAATVIVLGFGALNASRYLPPEPRAAVEQSSQPPVGLSRVTISVKGMTCATCEFAVNRALRNVDGVHTTNASAARNAVTVEYNPEETSIAKLVEAINATGYSAILPQKELR